MGFGGKTGGRKRGVPNKITGEVRALFKAMLDNLAPEAEAWIRTCATGDTERNLEPDPGKACDLLLRLAEFHIPKLQRLTVDITKIPIEEIAAELARREATEAKTEGAALQ